MDEKSTIVVTISGKEYLFTVERSKQEIFKLAERKVNNAVLKLEKRGIADYSKSDLLALAALDMALSNIKLRQQTEVESEELERLKELDKRVDEYINKR